MIRASATRTDSMRPEATSPPPTMRTRLPLSCHARRREPPERDCGLGAIVGCVFLTISSGVLCGSLLGGET